MVTQLTSVRFVPFCRSGVLYTIHMNEASRKKRNLIIIGLLTLVGLIAGYLYYAFIGCTTGCAITSYPLRSTLYGGLIGLILSFAFVTPRAKDAGDDADDADRETRP